MTPSADCCGDIFDGFTFADFRQVEPPRQRGVYVIRVMQRGEPISTVLEHVRQVTDRIGWPMLTGVVLGRVDELERITSCDTIYIGAAGTRENSKRTLLARYRNFAGCHVAMYPVWSLLAHGWQLIYGWKALHEATRLESDIKASYKRQHNDRLPALVRR